MTGPAKYSSAYVRRMLLIIAIGLAFAIAGLLIVALSQVLLLVFAGILLGVGLRGLSDTLAAYSGLSGRAALVIVLAAIVLAAAGIVWLLGPRIAAQIDQLSQELPHALPQLRALIASYAWGRRLLSMAPTVMSLLPGRHSLVSMLTGFASTALDALANIVVIVFVGLYLAAEPELYLNSESMAELPVKKAAPNLAAAMITPEATAP
jgi:predicted PurR-regulated permease PerM